MGRREEISRELDQLAIEIEQDALRAHGEHAPKIVLAPDMHVLVEIIIPQHASSGLQIRISTQRADDGGTS